MEVMLIGLCVISAFVGGWLILAPLSPAERWQREIEQTQREMAEIADGQEVWRQDWIAMTNRHADEAMEAMKELERWAK